MRFRLSFVMRMIALVVVLQVSGAIHGLVDLWASVAGSSLASDCDEDSPGKHCPAGCPNCHCVGRTNVVPPQVVNLQTLLAIDDSDRLPVRASDARHPQGPPQAALYRPPRASLSA